MKWNCRWADWDADSLSASRWRFKCFLGYRWKQSGAALMNSNDTVLPWLPLKTTRRCTYEQQWCSVSLVTAENKAALHVWTAMMQCFLGYRWKQSGAALMNSSDAVFPWLPLKTTRRCTYEQQWCSVSLVTAENNAALHLWTAVMQCFLGYRWKQSGAALMNSSDAVFPWLPLKTKRRCTYEQQWCSVSLVTAENKAALHLWTAVMQCFLGYRWKQRSAALMNSNDTVFPWLPLKTKRRCTYEQQWYSVSLVTAENKAALHLWTAVMQCFLGYHWKQSSAALMNFNMHYTEARWKEKNTI